MAIIGSDLAAENWSPDLASAAANTSLIHLSGPLGESYNQTMFKLAKSHRSIRSFTTQEIEDSLLDEILFTSLHSSSAGNMQT